MNRRSVRVLMTADTVGGVWNYALELAAGLAPYGVHVVLATMGGAPSEAQRRHAARIPGLELHASAHALEWMREPWADVAAAGEWLLRLARRAQCDLVHVNGYVHAALPWGVPVLVVGHSCVWSWFAAVRGQAPGPEWERYRRLVGEGLRAASAVTAPTKAMLAALHEHHGPFAAVPPIANGRRAAHWPALAKEPFVLTAGRLWDEAKDVATLERAAPRVRWPILAAGPLAGPDGEAAISLRAVQALGPRAPARMAELFGRAAIFCSPARYEPFGLAVLEAALAGCALVLADIPTFRELWSGRARFVAAGDAAAFAAALDDLAASTAERVRLGAAARARALDLNSERMARRYLLLYATLLGRRPREGHAVTERRTEAMA